MTTVTKQTLGMHWNDLLALKVSNHAEKDSVTSDIFFLLRQNKTI